MGSSWTWNMYESVRDHLRKKSCALDGRQYAREHDYPELAYGDPHSPRITVVEEPDIPEDIDDFSEQSEHQAPSRRSSQFYSNEYQPPAWPRAIYELFVLAWSIAVVILSVGVDRVTRVVGRTRP
ncbi:hypothetical protein PM082_022829 [Marasmius tenuissimus]|nr:hypothetical protein PM082_022829 [Marasmius tenuissimus]